MTRRGALVFVLLVLSPLSVNGRADVSSIIPAPRKIEAGAGAFELTRATSVVAGPGTLREANKLAAHLRAPTGFALPVVTNDPGAGGIRLELDEQLSTVQGPEAYLLSITPERVIIRAGSEAGLFYGGVTFRQLLPPQIFGTSRAGQVAWKAPCTEIEDSPRFPWRGLLLDTARHFFPPEFIERLVDVMAMHKLNMLQLHLTDDQGWRIEIKKFPRLTQVGSARKESPAPGDRNRGDGTPYGPFFYTQQQIRELVAYAGARHVTLVPEIEIPGHFLAAVAAYPQFSCLGRRVEVRTRWGIEPDILCPGNDEAVAFAKDVLAEVCELFPGRFIHIGGDEAPRQRWKECPRCQARLKAEGLKGEARLQTWLNHRLEEFLASKGRRLIGWDEILEGGLTPQAAVMSWRGTAGGVAAAEAGHDVVMSPTAYCYFDYAQAKGPGEPECIGNSLPLQKAYEFDPMPQGLAPSRRGHILGGQGNIWTEYMRTPRDVEYFAFPRAAALAEAVWSPATGRDFGDFLRRLVTHLKRLDEYDLNYRRLDAGSPALAQSVAATPSAAVGRHIYVDAERGEDTAPGSKEAPLRTAQRAVDRAGAGDTIHLFPKGAVVRQAIVLRGKERLTIEGNGVTLTGADLLPSEGWEDLGGDLARRRLPRTPMDRHLLIVAEKLQRMGRSPTVGRAFPAPEELVAGQFAWVPIDEKGGWLYVRGPRKHLQWSVRLYGLAIQNGNRDLVIRNLNCRHALNDGFNIHGDSQGLSFENISGYENFDEGFSAHETSQCRIDVGRFWGNDNAVADVGESQTNYRRCEFRDSVSVDVLFQGGLHALDGCVVRAAGAKALSITPGVVGKEKRRTPVECRLTGCDIRGCADSPRPIVATAATLRLERCVLRGLLLQIQGCRTSVEGSTLDGQPIEMPGVGP
ncbi:MAG TPA: family 20 glycosylhydrolase [Verrucomicrobiae bacterium]|nr:family 20 glycosylhydrolase [Verrucomicrobiae bacterium]